MCLSRNVIWEIKKVIQEEYLNKNEKRVRKRYKSLKGQLQYYDRLKADIEHEIEFVSLRSVGIKEKERLFNRLHDVLIKRRKVKDLNFFYVKIIKYFEKDIEYTDLREEILECLERGKKRKYKKNIKRIRDKRVVRV